MGGNWRPVPATSYQVDWKIGKNVITSICAAMVEGWIGGKKITGTRWRIRRKEGAGEGSEEGGGGGFSPKRKQHGRNKIGKLSNETHETTKEKEKTEKGEEAAMTNERKKDIRDIYPVLFFNWIIQGSGPDSAQPPVAPPPPQRTRRLPTRSGRVRM